MGGLVRKMRMRKPGELEHTSEKRCSGESEAKLGRESEDN